MKKKMQRLLALVMALLFTLSANAEALESFSNTWGLSDEPAQQQAEQPEPSATQPVLVAPEESEHPVTVLDADDGGAPELGVDLTDATPEPEATPEPPVLYKGKVSAEGGVKVHIAPSVEAEELVLLEDGAEVDVFAEVTGVEGEWYSVRTEDGQYGYIFGEYLIPEELEPEPTEVVSEPLALTVERHEWAQPYVNLNETAAFDVAVQGGAADGLAVSYRVEYAGAEIEQGTVAVEPGAEDAAVYAGALSYVPAQEGAYRLTVTAEDAEASAVAQLSFVAVDPEKREYVCGKEEHIRHEDSCYAMVVVEDNGGPSIEVDGVNESLQPVNCPFGYLHTHSDACLPQCGEIAHTHVAECYDDAGELICALPEHTHGPDCLVAAEEVEVAFEEVDNSLADRTEVKLNGDDLKEKGVSMRFRLYDKDDNPLTGDSVNVTENEKYKMRIDITAEAYAGSTGGTLFFNSNEVYTYDLPDGVDASAVERLGVQEGHDDVTGLSYKWKVEDGKIKFWFDESIDSATKVNVHFDLDLKFHGDGKDLKFGDLDVHVSKPEAKKLVVNKHHTDDEVLRNTSTRDAFKKRWKNATEELWSDDEKFGDNGPDKLIFWEVDIEGGTPEELAAISDQIFTGDYIDENKAEKYFSHTYTTNDQKRNVLVYATDPEGKEHSWSLNVEYGTDGKSWTGSLNQAFECRDCHKTFTPNNGQWTFKLYYTSTIDAAQTNGMTYYGNTVNVGDKDGKRFDLTRRRWGDVVGGGILKNLENDKNKEDNAIAKPDTNGNYTFTIEVDIPRCVDTNNPVFGWGFRDSMDLWGQHVGSKSIPCDQPERNKETGEIVSTTTFYEDHEKLFKQLREPTSWTVTTEDVEGNTTTVSNDRVLVTTEDPTHEDPNNYDFIVRISGFMDWNMDQIRYSFYTPCKCRNKDYFQYVDEDHGVHDLDGKQHYSDTKFCLVWDETKDVQFKFTYTISADLVNQALKDYIGYEANGNPEAINGYLGGIHRLENTATLYTSGTATQPTKDIQNIEASSAWIPYEPILSKEMVEGPDADGNVKYEIRVNENHAELEGDSLTIYDKMTGMTFVSGSVAVKKVDDKGNETTLDDSQFTVVTKPETEAEEKLDFTFRVRISGVPEKTTDAYVITYKANPFDTDVSNEAWGNFYGEKVRVKSVTVLTMGSWGNKLSNKVMIHKSDATKSEEDKDNNVGGATYALYMVGNDGQHYLQTEKMTDGDGTATFSYDPDSKLVLAYHAPYYIKETKPAHNYALNNTEYWVVFCNNDEPTCDVCNKIRQEHPTSNITRIKSSASDDELTIKVTDSPVITANPEVKKIVLGMPTPSVTKSFKFTLAEKADDDPKAKLLDGAESLTLTITTNDQGTSVEGGDGVYWTGSFDKNAITFDRPGTYTFTITEQPDEQKEDTWEYDKNNVWTVTYVVGYDDEEKGTLKIESKTYTQGAPATEEAEHSVMMDVDGAEIATFTNTYKPEEGTWTPKVKKVVNGPVPEGAKNRTFTFELTDETTGEGANDKDGYKLPDAPKPYAVSVEWKGADIEKEFSAPITFKKAGTYTFTIRETSTGDKGFTNDPGYWTVTVVVEDVDGQLTLATLPDGGLNPKYTYSGTSDTAHAENDKKAAFVNTYKPTEVTWQPSAEKTVVLSDGITALPNGVDKTFNFTLEGVTKDGFHTPADSNKRTANVTVTVGPDGKPVAKSAQFTPAITFSEAGTYYFEVREAIPTGTPEIPSDEPDKQGYYQYDDGYWTVEVEVTDTNGALVITKKTFTHYTAGGDEDHRSITETAVGTLPFSNTYKPTPDKWQPQVRKVVVSDGLKEEDIPKGKEFEFSIEASGTSNPVDGAKLPDDTTAKAANGVTAKFGEIEFSKPGDYEFTIDETSDGKKTSDDTGDGYIYDQGTWTLKVHVEDQNGALKVTSAEYTYNAPEDSEDDAHKTYHVENSGLTDGVATFVNEYAPEDGAWTPEVQKIITPAKEGYMPNEGEKETFTFTLSVKGEDIEAGTLPDGVKMPAVRTITIKGAGTASFNQVEFTKEGEYTFYIKELPGKNSHYTYDGGKWTIEVNVGLDKATHTLKPTVTSRTYEPATEGGAGHKAYEEDTNIVYFENTYTTTEGEWTPVVEKVIEVVGDQKPEKNKTFTFEVEGGLTDKSGNVIADSKKTITGTVTGADEVTSFTPADSVPVKLTDTGKYSFTITEKAPDGEDAKDYKGYLFDGGTWTVTFEVVDEKGTLTAKDVTYTYTAGTEEGDYTSNQHRTSDVTTKATFRNKYEPLPVDYAPWVKKAINFVAKQGSTSSAPATYDETFTFVLTLNTADPADGVTDKDGVKLTSDKTYTVTVNGKGEKAFEEAIHFTKTGTYTFTIKEQVADADKKPGFTYSNETVTLKVTVTDQDGQLVATAEYTPSKNSTTIETEGDFKGQPEALITNTYNEPVEYVPKVSKTATGDVPGDKETEFTFTIAAQGTYGRKVVMPSSSNEVTFTVTGAGNASEWHPFFGGNAIKFYEVGDYYFTISEKEFSGKGGFSRDTRNWTLHVSVTADPATGALKESVTYQRSDESGTNNEGAQFVNSYSTTAVDFGPQVHKTVVGEGAPANEEFEFELTLTNANPAGGVSCVTGKTIQTVTVKGDETKQFDAVNFTKTGTYTFKIHEVTGTNPAFDYATQDVTVTVKIKDTDGMLGVQSVTYTPNVFDVPSGVAPNNKAALFTNTYHAPVDVEPQVKKTVGGDVPEDREATFKFKLNVDSSHAEAMTQAAEDGWYVVNADVLPMTRELTITGKGSADTLHKLFGSLTFKHAGDYYFTIQEADVDAELYPGYSKDSSVWYVHVAVTANSASKKLEKTVTYSKTGGTSSNSDAAAFENTYQPGAANFTPKATKRVRVTSGTPVAASFTFQLEAVDSPATDLLKSAQTKTLNWSAGDTADKTVTFDQLTFSAAGDYHFKITETAVTDGGNYARDTAEYTLTVTVTDVDGQLQVAEQYYEDGKPVDEVAVVFDNTYTPKPTTATPDVTKELTGELPEGAANDKTFTFTLAPEGDFTTNAVAAEDVELDSTSAKVTVSHQAGAGNAYTWQQKFGGITFRKTGTYKFTIEEGASGASHVTDDTAKWTFEVTVTDASGQLTASSKYYKDGVEAPGAAAAFENNYEPSGTDYTPQVNKAFLGDTRPVEKTFTFTLSEDSFDPEDGVTFPASRETTVTGTGTANFGEVKFSKAGTYEFTIQEKKGSEPGYKYDESVWTLTVVVVDNNGALSVQSHTYEKTGASNTSYATFTNEYHVTETKYAPHAQKTVSGSPVPAASEQTFTFTLAEQGAAQAGVTMPGAAGLTRTLTGNGTVTFGDITFTQAGTYNFTITERDPPEDAKGWVYDTPRSWNVAVTVEDRASQLTVTNVTYTAAGKPAQTGLDKAAQFVNTYHPEGISAVPSVTKIATGDVAREISFQFTIRANDNYGEKATLTAPQSVTVTVTPANKTPAAVNFGAIRFTEAGTYKFTISETDPKQTGWTYDSTAWTLEVEVVDDGGQLRVASTHYTASNKADSDETATFTNAYETTETAYTPKVSKAFSSTSATRPSDKTFNFTLKPASGNPDGASLSGDATDRTSVTGTGSANFGEITFTKAGTYKFTIAEEAGSDAGYGYDPSEWTLTVVVTDENSVLTVKSHSYAKEGASSNSEAAFTNDYTTQPADYEPQVRKTVTGLTPEDKTFTFTLAADTYAPVDGKADGAELQGATEVTVKGSGEAKFGKVHFTKAGTYSFTIRETAGSDAGYAYDGSVWTLTVVVEDHDSQLEVTSATYAKGGESNDDAASFTNDYTTKPTEYKPEAEKEITGYEPEEDETFTFTLAAGTFAAVDGKADGAAMPEDVTASVTGRGEATDFGAIEFSKAGTYTFTIAEDDEGKPGYTYDESVWTLTVKVVDDGGQLRVDSAVYSKTGVESGTIAKFANRYEPVPTSCAPEAKKEIRGPKPGKDRTFTFELSKAEENEKNENADLPEETTASVTGTGTAHFGEITFHEAGTYTFTIAEQAGEDPGYTYDESVWTLTVEVEDTEGVLSVKSCNYAKAGGPAEAETATFTNDYAVKPTDYEPKVEKKLTGNETPGDKTFTFELKRDGGNPEGDASMGESRTVTVTGSGSATYDKIQYTLAGTYRYTITERDDNEPGYTYDGSEWTLTVVVVDNDSQLEVQSATYAKDGVEVEGAQIAAFTNDYKPSPTAYAPEVSKAITSVKGPASDDKEFVFELTAAADCKPSGYALPEEQTATVTGAHDAKFEEIGFTEAGTYKFEIREQAGEDAGYDYDPSVWTLTVEITDDNGTLKVTGHRYEKAEAESSDERATFTNTYTTEDTEYAPKVRKVIAGDAREEEQKRTFTFELTEAAGNENPENGAVLPEEYTATVTDEGEVEFDPAIQFQLPGTYTFTIREQIPDPVPVGYNYDEGEWTLTVEITDVDSKLTVTKTEYVRTDAEPSETEATFTNSYAAPVKESVRITKEITGGSDVSLEYLRSLRTVEGKSFEFELKAYDGEEAYADVKYGADKPSQRPVNELMAENGYIDSKTVTIEELKEAGWQSGAIFEEFVFSRAGSYRFLITEKTQEERDWAYDQAEWLITVTVTDKRDSAVDTAAGLTTPLLTASVQRQKIRESDGEDVADIAADESEVWFTNVYTMPTVRRGVTKVWVGDTEVIRPASIVARLYRNGESYDAVTLNAENDWSYVWEDLPEYDADGITYEYTVAEDATPGNYRASVSEAEELEVPNADGTTTAVTSFTITNTYVPPVTARTVTKVWDDVGNLDGTRAASVTVQLLADNMAYRGSVTLSAANDWTYRWDDLPLYREGTLTRVNYEVVETSNVAGYTTTVTNGATTFTVTNSHTPNPVSYSVRKVWDDGDNIDGIRPANIQVQLLANGAVYDTQTLSAPNWSYTWTNLPASANGAAVDYTVVEVNGPAEYESTVVQNGTEFVITNSYEPLPQTTELTGTKVWIDQNDVRGLRPDAIQVRLYQNGTLMPGRVPTWTRNGNVWTYRFANLPYADANRVPYTYTVDEVPVPGYTTEINGTTITNTINPQTIAIEGLKTWVDNNNAAGLRPAQIVVRLLRDGVVIQQQTVMAANGWRYRFANLPDSDPATGRMYEYTIREELVDGYYTRVDGYNLINTLLPPDDTTTIDDYDTPLGIAQLGDVTEEELEGLVEIGDYDTPLWGDLLQTGDDLPVYPFVSGGIGVLALLVLLLGDRKKRKKEQ